MKAVRHYRTFSGVILCGRTSNKVEATTVEEAVTCKVCQGLIKVQGLTPQDKLVRGIFCHFEEDWPADKRLNSEGIELVNVGLKKLRDREEWVLKLFYGFEPIVGKEGKARITLADVGEVVGATRERIRQIKLKAFRKLRHPQMLGLKILNYTEII